MDSQGLTAIKLAHKFEAKFSKNQTTLYNCPKGKEYFIEWDFFILSNRHKRNFLRGSQLKERRHTKGPARCLYNYHPMCTQKIIWGLTRTQHTKTWKWCGSQTKGNHRLYHIFPGERDLRPRNKIVSKELNNDVMIQMNWFCFLSLKKVT